MTSSTEKRTQLYRQVDRFLDSPSTLPADIAMLSNYLDHDPKTVDIQDPLPVDEVEERLEIAKEIQAQEWSPFRDDDQIREELRLTAMHLSIIMAVPLNKLREHRHDLPFDEIHRLVRLGMLIFLHSSLPHSKQDYWLIRTSDSEELSRDGQAHIERR